MEKGIRNFSREVLVMDDEIEAFCIVPELKEGQTAEGDKSLLKTWAYVPDQTHSLNVGILEKPGQVFLHTDALITFLREVAIGVVTADCVPILLHAPDIKAVAAVHAGWKGTIGGIINNVLEALEKRGADLSKLRVIFGPSISQEAYEVDDALGQRFFDEGFGDCVGWPNGIEAKPHVDLQGVNIEMMERCGVKSENILRMDECTYSSARYHSYRRDGERAGRQLTAIVMR